MGHLAQFEQETNSFSRPAHACAHTLFLRLAPADMGLDLMRPKIAKKYGHNGMPHNTTQHSWMLLAGMLVHGGQLLRGYFLRVHGEQRFRAGVP
jgi:hypothetical protein